MAEKLCRRNYRYVLTFPFSLPDKRFDHRTARETTRLAHSGQNDDYPRARRRVCSQHTQARSAATAARERSSSLRNRRTRSTRRQPLLLTHVQTHAASAPSSSSSAAHRLHACAVAAAAAAGVLYARRVSPEFLSSPADVLTFYQGELRDTRLPRHDTATRHGYPPSGYFCARFNSVILRSTVQRAYSRERETRLSTLLSVAPRYFYRAHTCMHVTPPKNARRLLLRVALLCRPLARPSRE